MVVVGRRAREAQRCRREVVGASHDPRGDEANELRDLLPSVKPALNLPADLTGRLDCALFERGCCRGMFTGPCGAGQRPGGRGG